MATFQTTYSNAPAKGLPGQIANEEKCNKISRTVESAAGIEFGQPAFRGASDHGVVAGGTFAGTATSAAGSGNVGNGTMGAITVSAGAKKGVYKLVIIEPVTNAGAFEVTDPDGVFVDNGTVGVAFSAGGLAFTLLGRGDRLEVGQDIVIFPGCDLSADMGDLTYDNLANHGGFGFMSKKSPFDGNPIY